METEYFKEDIIRENVDCYFVSVVELDDCGQKSAVSTVVLIACHRLELNTYVGSQKLFQGHLLKHRPFQRTNWEKRHYGDHVPFGVSLLLLTAM